jgi:hypothetical protein
MHGAALKAPDVVIGMYQLAAASLAALEFPGLCFYPYW